jgi:hypothetical protein
MTKNSFFLLSGNLVQILSESVYALDPDPHSCKMLEPDPHIIYADPKHWWWSISTIQPRSTNEI